MIGNGNARKIVAPAIFIVCVLSLEVHRIRSGMFYTSAPIFPLVVLVAIVNGSLWGFIAALVASFYSIYITPDLTRSFIVASSYFGIAALVSYLNQRVREIDTVEKLLHKLRLTHALLLSQLVNWPDMDDGEKWQMVESINDQIADVLTMARGWHALAEERESLDEE